MKLKRKELRILIERMINEEDLFSATRKSMAGQEAAASEADQQEIDKIYEEELRLTAQFFNETVRSAFQKDPNNFNIKVAYDYIIADSESAEAFQTGAYSDPSIRKIGKSISGAFGKIFSGDARYFVCIKKGQTIKSIDDRIEIMVKTPDDLVGKSGVASALAGYHNLTYGAIGNLVEIFTFEQIYKLFEATADASGIDVKSTYEEANPR